VQEIELRDWEEFKEFSSRNFGGSSRHIFRGHADRAWKLESTLTRLGKRIASEFPSRNIENLQLKNFRMKIRGLRGSNPQELDDNGLWALGQHYGLCTPLLDWSESIYVSVYFAFENPDSCSSGWRTIYALDKFGVLHQLQDSSKEIQFLEPLHDDNRRITAQAGLFTKIPTGSDLESWLSENDLSKHLIKLHVENDCRLDVINDLRLMNITGASIYPDLHGASTTCNMFIETLSENYETSKRVRELMKEFSP
jgi:hypothetical protein